MEALTTIRQIFAGNEVFVPSYQRAYSWETELNKSKPEKHTNVFISDLENYRKSNAKTPYYFGHFLFEDKLVSIEEKLVRKYAVIDGQQRLTTIVIFLSALFARLRTIKTLSESESISFEDIIRRYTSYHFATVEYDNQLFMDYVIDQCKKDRNGLETTSANRIVIAFDYFVKYLSEKDEDFLTKILNIIQNATCTTHLVKDETEAIQMFIFQNNRGKKPSKLEIIKAQFMFNIHLYGGEQKNALIKEIKERFEKIYKSISAIEYNIHEDHVLTYTLRVYFNSLWENDATEKINKMLAGSDSIIFIKSFTQSLAISFEHLTIFFGKDERENNAIHSLVVLNDITVAIPFLLKAYKFGLSKENICKLCSTFESIILRDRLIGTRADITSRINDVYQKFDESNSDIKPIIDRINWMKNVPKESYYWAYWNNTELEYAIQRGLNSTIAKYLLWKYENLLESQGKSGYSIKRYDDIDSPELEHIAPQTPTNGEPIAAGYCEYDKEFREQYIDCLGNYLLLSKPHNCSIGNKPFSEKRKTYTYLAQQREIQQMTAEREIWSKELIKHRKDKIISFILNSF